MAKAGRLQLALAAAVAAAVASGCGSVGPAPVGAREGYGPAPAGHYRIRSGDTLYSIASKRSLNYRTLARWNGIDPPYRIYAGKLLRVQPPAGGKSQVASKPDRSNRAVAEKASPARKSSESAASARTGVKPPRSKASPGGLNWRWPLDGRVTRTFRRGDRTRQGLRIAGRAGQRVVAAEGGAVVYSGSGLKGYGNLIIVKHNKEYLSAYGFNRRLLVKEGEQVKRGQIVAEVGQASGGEYLLHFEIRRDGTAVDPLVYLPGAR